jgi:transposase
MEAAPPSLSAPGPHLAAGQRGLKRGLSERPRTVRLMLAETIGCETPPWYRCYGRIGEQGQVPITGNRRTRVLHGAITIWSGAVLVLITNEGGQETPQSFLSLIRSHWRGWQIVLFEDRGSPHTAEESLELAQALGLEPRFLPTATPDLNAMAHLWRHGKGRGLADRPTCSLEASAYRACQDILHMTPHERLRKAGVLSGDFWLTT